MVIRVLFRKRLYKVSYWVWVTGLDTGNGSGIGLEVGKNTRERNERRRKIA